MSGNPFDELEAQTQDTEPTLTSAAMEIREALSQSLTAKGLHRPRPLSWGKRIARTHFGWTRIGEKKWNEILEIGARDGLWTIDEKRRLTYTAEINDSEDVFVSQTQVPSSGSSHRRGTSSMAGFYRDGGMFGGWKLNTEDDWDGKTYSVIRLAWMDKAIEVPSWLHGRTVYELYDKKVREDLANGVAQTYCTSCKSQCSRESVYPDSHGRIACSACNDKMDPRLIKPEGWVPPARGPVKAEIKVPQGPITPEKEGTQLRKPRKQRSKKKGAAKKLRDSVRKDGKADLMDAAEAIQSAE